jgi:dolichol kinase
MTAVSAEEWPFLSGGTKIAMVAVNVGALVAIWVLLRVVWKPPPKAASSKYKLPQFAQPLNAAGEGSELSNPMSAADGYGSINGSGGAGGGGTAGKPPASTGRQLESGQVAGDYSEDWRRTFDATFLGIMTALLATCSVLTTLYIPGLWHDTRFWLCQLPKLGMMMAISLIGGALCRCYCSIDDEGYIITKPGSKFKVNYTRKLQHFGAYLVPMIVKGGPTNPDPAWASLYLAWGQFFTLLAFLVLIKPLRERSTFLMVQFNSMDRPEDRPNTMKWLIGGNIIPGTLLITLFTHLYNPTGQQGLAMIFVFITGLGDGLAEPVGVTVGRHKYKTSACCSKDKFTRSWEGSACVFMSGMIFPCTFYTSFANEVQMWMAIAILPPVMAYAEATAPHTMDTPVLMGLGGVILLGICQYHPGYAY